MKELSFTPQTPCSKHFSFLLLLFPSPPWFQFESVFSSSLPLFASVMVSTLLLLFDSSPIFHSNAFPFRVSSGTLNLKLSSSYLTSGLFLPNNPRSFGYDHYYPAFLSGEVVRYLSRKMKDWYYSPRRKEGYPSCMGLAAFPTLMYSKRRVSQASSVE